jgi:tetratricopeptide (TPR) repeat protein
MLLDVPTTDTVALERYLLGMQITKRATWEALRQGESYLEEAISMDPSFAEAWVGLAHVRSELFQTGAMGLAAFIDGAGSAIETGLSLDPRNGEAHAVYARVQDAAGKTSAAEASFEEALRLSPQSALVHESYGEFLRSHSRLEEAGRILRKGLELDPLSPFLMFQLGRVEMYLGNPEANIDLATRILELDPLNIQGYVATLQANLWRGRYDEAWHWYVKAIEIGPNDHETWGHIAIFMDDLGAGDLADRYMEQAELIGSGEPVVVKGKVQILYLRGQTSDALELATTYLTDDFDNRWGSNEVLLRTIANTAVQEGNFEDIIGLYEHRHPELFMPTPEISLANISVAANLAWLLQRADNPDRAKKIIDTALHWYQSTQPDGVHGYLLSIVDVHLLALAGETERALETLRDAVDNGWRWEWQWALSNNSFDTLRDAPEFRQIVADIENDMAAQRQTILASPHLGEFDLRDKPAE